MIWKTQRNFRRCVTSGDGGMHNEVVLRETWWFLILPIYSRDTIERTSL